MAASLPSTAAGWSDWMVSFMGDALGSPQRGRAPCSAEERALGQARPSRRVSAPPRVSRARAVASSPRWRCVAASCWLSRPRVTLPTRCAQALGTAWASWGYDVAHEPFLCAPHAFLGAIPLAVLLWVRALRVYDARPFTSLASCALGVAIFVAEVVLYREALEVLRIFPVAQGATPSLSPFCNASR